MPSSWLLPTEKTILTVGETSDVSLAEAMKKLFNENSDMSLSSDRSHHSRLPSLESLQEALQSLFGSDIAINKTVADNSSYPATPCNSAQSVKSRKAKHGQLSGSKSQSNSSESLRLALRRLFAVSDDDLKEALPGASKESISSLGIAMRRLFQSISDTNYNQESKESTPLSTSNQSLSDAMRWLFNQSSKESLASSNSSDSMLLWGLFDNAPEEFKELDIRAHNESKKNKKSTTLADNIIEKSTPKDYDCWLLKPGMERKRNPDINSVIRSSSPDRDANISYPKYDKIAATNHVIMPQSTRAVSKSIKVRWTSDSYKHRKC